MDNSRLIEHIDRHHTILIVVFVFFSIVVIALAITAFILWQQGKRLKRMRAMLSNRHRVKDGYIRQLIKLCALYMQTLYDMNITTSRKLKAKQYQDLLTLLENGRMMRQQRQQFYEVFDKAIIESYPDFFPSVNKLLLPDKRFKPDEYENGLNTELRLLSFMLLGIDASSDLSKFLGLSLNSVYTYRNKLKSRALVKDTFEDDVRNLA